MQPNTITLSVNEDNDDGTTALVDSHFTLFEEFQNRSEYIHTNHTMVMRDKLGFYRTQPKINGNFRGMAKSAVKFTKDHMVPGVDTTTEIIAPSIIEIRISNPVGMTPAETLAMVMRAAAFLPLSTIVAPLVDQLQV
jgi:hypothetical protein